MTLAVLGAFAYRLDYTSALKHAGEAGVALAVLWLAFAAVDVIEDYFALRSPP